MNPFLACRLTTLYPLHRTVPLLFFHANMAMIVGFNFVTAFGTVKIVIYKQILVIFKLM